MNPYSRLKLCLVRFKFEFINEFGIFKLIKKLNLKIKEPYNKYYERSLRNNR